jgi:hypothetical protein
MGIRGRSVRVVVKVRVPDRRSVVQRRNSSILAASRSPNRKILLNRWAFHAVQTARRSARYVGFLDDSEPGNDRRSGGVSSAALC